MIARAILGSRQDFQGPKITVEAQVIERFCSVIKNDSKTFKPDCFGNVQAPLDFAIVTD
jgi:fatty acid synthase subunit alpha, fungi type